MKPAHFESKHFLSIDIETYATDPATAAIASIGAALFTWDEPLPKMTHFSTIKQHDALRYGRRDLKTDLWWEKQTIACRQQICNGQYEVNEAMARLYVWIKNLNENLTFNIIARSPQFDLVILKRHLTACHFTCPWDYWQEQDHRSYEEAFLSVLPDRKAYRETYVNHHALDDAIKQGEYLVNLRNNILAKEH